MKYSKIINMLAKNVESVPGFQNFASLYEDKMEINYSNNKDFLNAFIVDEGTKGLKIKMGVILLLNARTKVLIDQIRQEIMITLEKNNWKLESLDIFVQGVK